LRFIGYAVAKNDIFERHLQLAMKDAFGEQPYSLLAP
jgi:hypothetical protein